MRVLALAFVVLLFIGCTSQNNTGSSTEQTAQPSPNSTEAQPQPGEAEPLMNESGDQGPVLPNGTDAQQPQPETTASEYSGKDFAELASLGTPLECDINSTYQGKPAFYKVYMNGTSMLRVESATGLSQCSKTISVAHSDRIYFACEGKMVVPSCDWLREDYAVAGKSSTFDFTSLQPSQIACRGWAYDKTFFLTSGEVCHMGG